MKKNLIANLLLIVGTGVLIFLTIRAEMARAHTILGDASTLTRGTLPNARLDVSSVTMFGNGLVPNERQDVSSVTLRGNVWDDGLDAATTTLNNRINTVATDTGTLSLAVKNTTFTVTLGYPGYVFKSTTGFTNFIGGFATPGISTWNVRGVSCFVADNSTVGATHINLVVSSGGLKTNGITPSPMFPTVIINTGTGAGFGGYSLYSSTALTIYSGWWVGAQISTVPISGIMPLGLQCGIDLWVEPWYSR